MHKMLRLKKSLFLRWPFPNSYRIKPMERSIIIPSDAKEPLHIIQNVLETLDKLIESTPEVYNPEEFKQKRSKLMKYLPRCQSELPLRSMKDSFDQAIIPLKNDVKLREKYINILGNARLGRLLEDMDIFAVYLLYKHILNPKQASWWPSPFSVVTAMVDKIKFHHTVKANEDIKIAGHVTWVGKSSAEVTLQLHQKKEDSWLKIIDANFLLVAKDSLGNKPIVINQLKAETLEEVSLFEKGEDNRLSRKNRIKELLLITPPSNTEQDILHDFFYQNIDKFPLSKSTTKDITASIYPENIANESSVMMEDAILNNIVFCQPEYRNYYYQLFGGFIMRNSLELAMANAYCLTGKLPRIQMMHDVWFRKPVEIGSLLNFQSSIVYTHSCYAQVRVCANVLIPKTKESYVTNVLHYTFSFDEGYKAPNIVPNSYTEAVKYLAGRKHFLEATDNF